MSNSELTALEYAKTLKLISEEDLNFDLKKLFETLNFPKEDLLKMIMELYNEIKIRVDMLVEADRLLQNEIFNKDTVLKAKIEEWRDRYYEYI